MTNPARYRAAQPLALALALASGTAWAASGRVSGQVTQPDGRPVSGVEVASGEACARTDAGGLYALEGAEAGVRVVVSFSKEGHPTTYGAAEIPAAGDTDGDGVPDADDPCPASDRRPTVTIDGCDTRLGNGSRESCTAMDVLLDCSERVSARWHLLGCLVDPAFLHRVDGLTWKTFKRAVHCVHRATLPLEELGERPALPSATLHVTLLPDVATFVLDAAAGGRVERDGYAVTFPPGSIDAEGEVEVGLAPLDVTEALAALPGDSRAVNSSLEEVVIQPWGALQLTLAQAGLPVSLRDPDAQPATVEVLLPVPSPFEVGDRPALWSFDPTSGLWNELFPGGARVEPSSLLEGRLAVVAPVGRTGWWTAASSTPPACLEGHAEDANGSPVVGALVTASGLGVDHHALTSARALDDGSYCVEARPGSRVSVRASAVVHGLRLDSPPVEAETPLAAAGCGSAGCGAGPSLALPAVSCVSGRTLDAWLHPRVGVTVATSAGSAAASGPGGRFCLAAPAQQAVTVFAEGYAPATVETGGPATCPAGCAEVDLVPSVPSP